MKLPDYSVAVLYPFSFNIQEHEGKYIGECYQLPIVLECDSLEELKSTGLLAIDTYLEYKRKRDEKARRVALKESKKRVSEKNQGANK